MAIESSTAQKLRIGVAGATGRVGRLLTESLAAHSPGHTAIDVVALTRQPAGAKVPPGVATVGIDYERAETLGTALRGVDRLFISHGTSANQVRNEIALIDAAVTAGVQHIVKLSALGPATRLLPFAWHMQIEAHLAQQPVASTVLRPSAFTYLLNRVASQIAAGSWAGAAGNGRINFIDIRDVADVAHHALLETVAPQSQRAFHLTGPRAWTMHEVADELGRLLGHAVTYVHRSPAEQRAALIEGGMNEFVADLLVGLDQMFRDSALGETTSTIQTLTGNAPRTLTEWLTANLTTFRAGL